MGFSDWPKGLKIVLFLGIILIIVALAIIIIPKSSHKISSQPIIKEDPSKCLKLEIQYQIDLCYLSVATNNKDSSICEKISNKDIQDICTVYIELNPKKCEELKTNVSIEGDLFLLTSLNKDSCYSYIALAKEDNSLCNKIENPDLNKSCIAQIKKDEMLCYEIKDTKIKDMCFFMIASAKNKWGICTTIRDTRLKDNCLYNLIKAEKDEGLCYMIESDNFKFQCVIDIAIIKKDPKICGNSFFFENHPDEKDECYRKIALVNNDTSLCDNVKDNFYKSLCLKNIKEVNEKILQCEKISSEKASCYENLVVMYYYPQLCERLQDTREKETCYLSLGWSAPNN